MTASVRSFVRRPRGEAELARPPLNPPLMMIIKGGGAQKRKTADFRLKSHFA